MFCVFITFSELCVMGTLTLAHNYALAPVIHLCNIIVCTCVCGNVCIFIGDCVFM